MAVTTDDHTRRLRVTTFRTRWADRSRLVDAYVAVVAVSAMVMLLAAVAWLDISAFDGRWVEIGILLALLMWCEMRPITVVRVGGVDDVVVSMTFAFAIFLTFGALPAMAAQAAASIAADLSGRKPIIKVFFNVSQYCLAWGVAGFVFFVIQSEAPGPDADILTARWYLAVLGAGVAYVLINNLLVGIAIALHTAARIGQSVRSTVSIEWSSDIVLLALTPIVVIVMEQSVAALPLLVLPILAVYRSVTISAEKEHLALHDSLTDLPNRFNVTTLVTARLSEVHDGSKAAVMLFDLDHFKEINDTLGHQAGDQLLRMIGPRISSVLPTGSTVGRLGGDEFAVLVPTLSDDHAAFSVAHDIAEALEAPFRLEGFNIEVKGSIGIAIYPDDGDSSDELIKSADIAMYVAKTRGSVVERYDLELDNHSTRRLEMVGEMRTSIANGDMMLYVQPKFGLADGTIREVEALVRWNHPRHGLVAPSEFVPLSEHTGLIRPLTTHVLNEAVRQILRWRAAGIDLVVAVNLSARSLHDGFILEEVSGILEAAHLPAEFLRLEITEGSIMADPTRAMKVLEKLAEMGVRLSIDDFGTGYSSLAYLKELPVDEIKIDRSFVTNLLESEGDRVIVRSIIDLAENLGLTSVAEGVESAAALAWLQRAGCDQAQGYHIARPMPTTDFAGWLDRFDPADLVEGAVRSAPPAHADGLGFGDRPRRRDPMDDARVVPASTGPSGATSC